MRLTYFGNACWKIEGSLRIVLDPGGLFSIPKPGNAQVVCITHADPDHVNGLAGVTPEAPGILLGPKPLDSRFHFEKGILECEDWKIRPIRVAHQMRPWVPHRGYLLENHGIRILHLGDGNHPQEEVGPIDVLMVTVGGLGANPWQAAKLTEKTRPRRVFPMHALFNWQLEWFKQLIPRAEVLTPGESVLVER